MDAKDLKILKELDSNPRYSYSQIAKKTQISKETVQYRIQKLEENEVIQKYSVQLNNKKLGNDIEAFILLKVFPGQLRHVLEKINDFKEIKEAHRITGNQNIHLKVVVKNQICLQELLDQLMVFSDTNTFLILSKV